MARKFHEEHENAERWLLTYADLITLLLALFVVLWSMSKLDSKQVMESLAGAFSDQPGGEGVLDSKGGTSVVSGKVAQTLQKQAEAAKEIQQEIQNKGLDKVIKATYQLGKITLTLTGDVSFDPGSDVLTSQVKQALSTIKPSIDKLSGYPISIGGHTDNIPIHNARFPSNLHLSTARALSTAQYMINELSIDPKRVTVQGYGEYRPAVPNTSVENRAKNRRVEVSIITGENVQSSSEQ